MTIVRCAWCGNDPLYQAYHDQEWGVPVYDNQKLFEFLLLEGAQAGLSWITVLRKREHYRKVYAGFDPHQLARFTADKVAQLLQDPGIIRNKLKVNSAVRNAKCYLKLAEQGRDFSQELWQFVDGKPKHNRFKIATAVPASTNESDAMAKHLKKLGFNFVGSTICYAFMQAVGMVNDHMVTCYRHAEVSS